MYTSGCTQNFQHVFFHFLNEYLSLPLTILIGDIFTSPHPILILHLPNFKSSHSIDNCFLFVAFQNFHVQTQANIAYVLLFTKKVTGGSILYTVLFLAFSTWRSFYICAQCLCSFLQLRNWRMYHNLFCQSLVDKHVSCLQSLANTKLQWTTMYMHHFTYVQIHL